jgi:MoaA/NifB/PqqE/SkfB family radical SAM enzyme
MTARAARRYTFDRAPLRVYWEVTRACDLACRHCRAEAIARRHPAELDLREARRLFADLTTDGARPHLVLTGGDPFKRPDLFELIEAAREEGLPASLSPSATPLITPDRIRQLKQAGVEAISLSLDGASAERHDALRGVGGTFARTLAAARMASSVALPFQINTLVAACTRAELPAIYELARELGAARWSLFFLVQVGRGTGLEPVSPEQCERLMTWLAGLPRTKPLVTTTEAPHYRRIVYEQTGRRGGHGAGIRDGNGVMFISHTGDVHASGFLPLAAGNVRTEHPLTIYREAALFRSLRQADRFPGRCGACDFTWECGGSRARAFVASGDPLGEDPLCLLVSEGTLRVGEGQPSQWQPHRYPSMRPATRSVPTHVYLKARHAGAES